MLDIRTLWLLLPEDRYAPTALLRAVERAVYPLLRQRARPAPAPRGEETLTHPVPA